MEMMKLSHAFLTYCLLFIVALGCGALAAARGSRARKPLAYHLPQGPGVNPVDHALGADGEFQDYSEPVEEEGDPNAAVDGFSQGSLADALGHLNDVANQIRQGIATLDQKLAAGNDASATTVVEAQDTLAKAQKDLADAQRRIDLHQAVAQ